MGEIPAGILAKLKTQIPDSLIYQVDFTGDTPTRTTDTYNLGDMLLGNSFDENNKKMAADLGIVIDRSSLPNGNILRVQPLLASVGPDNPATRGFYVPLNAKVKQSLFLIAEVTFDNPNVTPVGALLPFSVGVNFKTGNQDDHPADIKTGPTCRFTVNGVGDGAIKLNLVVNAQSQPEVSFTQYSELVKRSFVLSTRIFSLSGDAELEVEGITPSSAGDLDPTVLGTPYDLAGFAIANQNGTDSVASARFQLFRLWATPIPTPK